MKISILCTNEQHPIMPYLSGWKARIEQGNHHVTICSQKAQLGTGDILFLISCSEKINNNEFQKYGYVLILHASDLPKGRGWSPHIWDILTGRSEITLSLIEAADCIDTGDIWKKINIPIPKHILWNEINDALFKGELELMNWAIRNYNTIKPTPQTLHEPSSYWPKRKVQDSRLDINKSLVEQFDLLRVCDPNRYPAYFELYDRKYKLKLEHYDEEK